MQNTYCNNTGKNSQSKISDPKLEKLVIWTFSTTFHIKGYHVYKKEMLTMTETQKMTNYITMEKTGAN